MHARVGTSRSRDLTGCSVEGPTAARPLPPLSEWRRRVAAAAGRTTTRAASQQQQPDGWPAPPSSSTTTSTRVAVAPPRLRTLRRTVSASPVRPTRSRSPSPPSPTPTPTPTPTPPEAPPPQPHEHRPLTAQELSSLRRERRRAYASTSSAAEEDEEEAVAAAAAAASRFPLSWPRSAGDDEDEQEVLMALAGSKWNVADDHEAVSSGGVVVAAAEPAPPQPPPKPTAPTPPTPPTILRRRPRRLPTASARPLSASTAPAPWWSPAPTPPWPPSGPGLAEAAAALLRLPLPESNTDLARLLGAAGSAGGAGLSTEEEDNVRLAVACVYVPGRIGSGGGSKKPPRASPASSSSPSQSADDPPAAYLYYIECPDGLDLAALQRQQQRDRQQQQQQPKQQQQPVFVSAAEARAAVLSATPTLDDPTPSAAPPPPPTLIIPSSWALAFDEYADAVLPDPAGGGGGWRSTLLAVRGGFSADERHALFPNAVAAVAQGRAAHNLRHARDLAEFLADARPEVLREHAANLVRVALSSSSASASLAGGEGGGGDGGRDGNSNHPLPPQWCLAQLRRKWGEAALRRHGIDVAFVIGLGS